jgi:hypothetical protein
MVGVDRVKEREREREKFVSMIVCLFSAFDREEKERERERKFNVEKKQRKNGFLSSKFSFITNSKAIFYAKKVMSGKYVLSFY